MIVLAEIKMFDNLFGLLGSYNSRIVKKYRGIVDKINSHEEAMIALSDAELANKTNEFKMHRRELYQ